MVFSEVAYTDYFWRNCVLKFDILQRMYGSLADLQPSNSAFFMDNISTIIACKEIKFSKITVVCPALSTIEFKLCIQRRFYRQIRILMNQNVHNDVTMDSPM